MSNEDDSEGKESALAPSESKAPALASGESKAPALASGESKALDFKTDVGNDAAKLISRVRAEWIDPFVLHSREESERSAAAFKDELQFADRELGRQHSREQTKTWFGGLTVFLIIACATSLFAIGKGMEAMALLAIIGVGGGGIAYGRLQQQLKDTEDSDPKKQIEGPK